jgi:tetratricopeptide (TPR) repeat protein
VGLLAARRQRSEGWPEALSAFLALGFATLAFAALHTVRSGDRLAFLVAMTVPAGYASSLFWSRRAPAPDDSSPAARQRPSPLRVAVLAGVLTAALSLPWLTLRPRAESAAEDHLLLAMVYERSGRPVESLAELERAVRFDPTHVLARLGLAGALARDGLLDQATLEADRASKEAPRFSGAWRVLALLYQERRMYEESAEAWKKLTELEPSGEAFNNLGTVYAALGRYEDSVSSLKKALELDPNHRNARINLTEIERRGPEGLSGAILSARGKTSGEPASAIEQGIGRAMGILQSGDLDGAEKALSELRSTYGATPELDFASGTLALQRLRFLEAIEFYERSRRKLKDNTILLTNLAAAYAQVGRLSDATALWEEALAQDPSNEMARKNLELARQKSVHGQ